MQAGALHLKYRPNKLIDFKGEINEGIVESLQQQLQKNWEQIPRSFLFIGPSGCVDRDTEFFSQFGWKKISDYVKGDKVLQYNIDGTARLTFPISFIKEKADQLNLIKTKYGVNQCLCDDHRVAYFIKHDRQMKVKTLSDIKIQHEKTLYGFTGKFKTTFIPIVKTKLPLSDDELRVQVMVIADAHIEANRNKCCLNIKKQRKIDRAEMLLKKAGINYDKRMQKNNYVRFYFVPPMRCKEFGSDFFDCSLSQLRIIADEILKWDGSEEHQQFSSTSTKSIDFAQYVFAATGRRSTIYKNPIKSKTKSICYTLSIAHNNFVGIGSSDINNKVKIKKYRTKDGYKYCFTVPSSYLVLRREGNIFVTGNCGKTTLARIVASELGCSQRDFNELNAANTRGIDTIREISSNCKMAPFEGRMRAYLIDETAAVTKDGQVALLKLLEDTPEHVFLFLCTTDPQNLLETIKNRCSVYQVGLWEINELYRHLKEIVNIENGKCSSKIIKRVAEEAGGSPRKALTMLDQVILMEDDQKALSLIKNHQDDDTQVIEICRLIIAKKSNDKWDKMRALIKGYTGEPESARKAILGYLRTTILNQSSQNDFANRAVYLYGLMLDKAWMYDGKDVMINALYEACNY